MIEHQATIIAYLAEFGDEDSTINFSYLRPQGKLIRKKSRPKVGFVYDDEPPETTPQTNVELPLAADYCTKLTKT